MRNIFLLIVFIITLPFFSNAKKLDSLEYIQHKEFFFNWDNDMFLFKDFYYTQGAKLFYVNPALRKNPVNHILFQLKDADKYYGLGLIQEIFTPKDVNNTLLSTVDRPYAGTIFLRSFVISSSPQKQLKFTTQFDIGILGPLSGAKQAQQIIHDWLDLEFPNGWDFQIENRPYINYNVLLEKGLISAPGIFEFMGNAQARVGNIHDDIQLGTMIRIGKINDYFKGYNLSNRTYIENKDFQAFIYGGATATAVFYNATLMGGIIPLDRIRQFQFNEIKNLIGELHGGLQMSYKSLGLKVEITWKTPEFEGGEHHGWGTVSAYFRFK